MMTIDWNVVAWVIGVLLPLVLSSVVLYHTVMDRDHLLQRGENGAIIRDAKHAVDQSRSVVIALGIAMLGGLIRPLLERPLVSTIVVVSMSVILGWMALRELRMRRIQRDEYLADHAPHWPRNRR